MDLRLTVDEEQLVAEILRNHQRELRLEISHTEHQTVRAVLRARARLLEEVLEKLGVSHFSLN